MEGYEQTLTLDHQLGSLTAAVEADAGFQEVIAALRDGQLAAVDGAWGSACALVATALRNQTSSCLLLISSSQKVAEDLVDDILLFSGDFHDSPQVVHFPAWESAVGERLVYDEIYGERLRIIKLLQHSLQAGFTEPLLIVTSIQSMLQPVPPRSAVDANTRFVNVGQQLDIDEFAGWMAQHGFHSTSAVELPGEFARRGGLIDVFGPDWTQPVRIELFDDEVESIRRFDVTTQRSQQSLASIDVTMLPSAGNSPMRAVTEREHLTDYLCADAWIALIEPDEVRQNAKGYLNKQEDLSSLHGYGETLKQIKRFSRVTISSLASPAGVTWRLQMESVERFRGDVAHVRSEVGGVAADERATIVCQTEAETQRLREVFCDTPAGKNGQVDFALGKLTAGFHWIPEAHYVLSGAELFGRSNLRRTARRVLGRKIDSFLDLRDGDLVVHLSHGVGRYRGMDVLTRESQVEEHLIVEFHGGTKVYVPVTKIHLVQKYVGASKARPKLAKIGGQSWVKQRQDAESAVTDMAAELLEIQAQRHARPGIAFGPDTEWQREFDASFPYEETPDQQAAIEAIKADMEQPRPMDRLLCGDVGFGKTEVAMRAAFKAVDNGYQVAVLVPTTILAEQHFNTFSSRMAEFPFYIAKLSRFCSVREQRETIQGLKNGSVDIVIGTHRLASKDVDFENLGLVIIDEEQRFGVEVKERLKSIRTSVDLLTMTATPIPRTLHMSMTGLRDISNLETPPEDRIGVETRVTRWDDELIRHAMLRELGRGGQVYFVHNRVLDIEILRQKLADLVPEARIDIGHGQMHEHHLEEVMVGFISNDFDVLLATTIVESGLDIPNANTIFIDDAQRYGLADLHQLRGRVGRYKRRAYCYLLLDKHQVLTPQSSRRLRAIEEFSEMGAGFAIAMRDLEFRGAGNVLGTQQSGHIAAIGYELYCELLEAAVRYLKKLPPQLKVEVNIDLPGRAFLPDDYVCDQRLKVDLYRRLARIASDDDLQAIAAEFVDRFGAPPAPAKRLLTLAGLRIEAAIWQIDTIRIEDDYLVFDYTDSARIRQLAKLRGSELRVVDQRSAYWRLDHREKQPDAILQVAESVLRPDGNADYTSPRF